MPTISSIEIFKRSRELKSLMNPCELCPRKCLANRLESQVGYCQLGDTIQLSSILPHHGEEPPISGVHGSGTVFLSGCNAACIFCQNYQISHQRMGKIITIERLAREFLNLQQAGCHNINWVTPTPHLPHLVESLAIAVEQGLNIPLVYNTNGYDRLEILQLLDGIVDIYLPDMKYSSGHWAE
ncbi:MAG: radical SAM protein, partial [Candidatus Marinimicrobia bacterium]|nr:radical SAM protein [Candidatus Neomarinimicrobiota bacterium]